VIGTPLLLGDDGYQVQRSLRFRSSASAYLNRTPASASNRQKFTISVWYKAGKIGVDQVNANIINAGGDGSSLLISGVGAFGATYNDRLLFREAGTTLFYWPMVFRDPAAWYHIVIVSDTTQATAANRAKLYVNGVDQGAFLGTAITQNTSTSINNTSAHYIGTFNATVYHSDLYYTEYNFIDGQALTPSSFGAINALTGVWSATKYAGTYGTNGFYLPFTDNSAATATTIGKDYSGNGNNWTPNNISVTAGATYDSMLDVPLGAGGGERGNYATLNPIGTPFANGTVTDGNLKFAGLTTTDKGVAATISISSGTFYWESTQLSNSGGSNCYAGVILTGASSDVNANKIYVRGDGIVIKYGTSLGTVFPTFTNNDVIGCAFDRANNTLALYKNGTLGYTVTGLNNADHTPWVGGYTTTDTWAINFGQRPFSYTPPTGFKALHTGNLGAPVIALPAQNMAATLYTGNGTSQVINNAVNGVSFQPDFVWGKARNNAQNHTLWNSVVGATKYLFSNATTAETTNTETLQSFNSNGYTLGNAFTNEPAYTYVGWQWKAGGTAVSNTAGSITSSVSANTTAGFSVVTYTGTGANATVGHGLGTAPSMVLAKSRSNNTGDGFIVYHKSLPSASYWLDLATTGAQSGPNSVVWNGTAPTSSVFSVGTASGTNTNTYTYVAYCFAPVAGYSAFGSYTGNGSADGPFVFLGFRPRFVLVKSSSNAFEWVVRDSTRSTYNLVDSVLNPNSSAAEVNGGGYGIDFLSNGFKVRAAGSATNGNTFTYIYMAFAEVPAKYSLAR